MKRFYLLSLGCPKNTVDSEVMAGTLMQQGYEPADSLDEFVDVALVNTCGFIQPAKEESIARILELAELKAAGRIGRLVVSGCLAQRYPEELRADMPEIDLLFGIDGVESAAAFLESAQQPEVSAVPHYIYSAKSPRAVGTDRPYAYLKIADGCNHTCGFCAIPAIRGPMRSRPIADIVQEATDLTEQGFRELILVAQDSTAYGRDLGMKDGLAELLSALTGIPGIGWIRPMYFFPGAISDRLLDIMAESDTICSYVDLPLQHAAGSVLRRMRRPYDGDRYLAMLARIRERVPGVVVRSAVITGFPGETDQDVDQLIAFLKAARFHHLGVFTYSREEGTPAEPLGDPIPEDVKEARRSAIMEVQQAISRQWSESLIGKELEVLVEGYSEETDLLLQGRYQGQAPDIDGVVLINDGVANIGEKRVVVIEDALVYDVIGRIVGV